MPTESISRPLILVVDDLPANVQVIADALAGQYDVAAATSGATAIEIATGDEPPALILLDIMMPGMDGYEVCRILKSDPRTRHIPVIFVTARTDTASEERGFELGAVDYITKPFNVAVVRARVRTHLTMQGLLDKLDTLNGQLNRRLTELTRAHQQLLRTQEQRELYTRVFENTADGILITDARGTILAVNPAFTRITGYTADAAIGKNPRILKSGHHPDAFYRALWASLGKHGYWQGEILNRRSNGEVYPELRTISAVRDTAGTTTHYVAVFSDISAVRNVQERLDFLTWYDPLTGLANRLLYRDHLQQAISMCGRSDTISAALFLDVDRFKLVNEARGLAVADRILSTLAGRLRTTLRQGDTLARLSADDFAIILPYQLPSRETAAREAFDAAERLRQAIAIPVEVDGTLNHLTASVGIALFPDHHNDDAADVLRRAETARHKCLAEGGNRALFFEADMDRQVQQRFNLEQQLHRAIAGDQLRLYLQPQVSDTGEWMGAEALLRWQHPEMGFVSPGDFIPLAEESDLILKIEAWVLGQVCHLLRRIQELGSPMRISVNISPKHFRRADFVEEIQAALRAGTCRGDQLVLELTEAVMVSDLDDVAAKMLRLANDGLRFSIDDFGVGYSGLAYLKRLPISELKIDCSYIRRAPYDLADAAIVDTILAIARQLRLNIVAEGVESMDHVAFLDARSPVGRQGFHYYRPMAANEWLAHIGARSEGGSA